MKQMRLPDFIVVGTQKAGTTSLHVWLSSLSGVAMPRDKEVSFFSSEERYGKGIEWYANKFAHAADGDVIGECSPNYLYSENAAARIKAHVPNARLIFIFREPIERAFSQYLMSVRKGLEPLSFQDALLQENERISRDPGSAPYIGYMTRGRYSDQLQRFREFFGDDALLYIKFEDLISNGERSKEALSRIGAFIGIRPDRYELSKENTASRPKLRWLRKILYSTSRWKLLLRFVIPSYEMRARLAHKLDTLNLRKIDRPRIEWVPRHVVELAMQECDRLESLTGLDLSDWRNKVSKYPTVDTRK